MSKKYWLGIDIGKETFEAALASLDADPLKWKSLPHKEFINDMDGMRKMLSWIRSRKITKEHFAGVCIEATGCLAWTWTKRLDGHLGEVSIVNPRFPKAYGTSLGIKKKNDRIDSCVAALYGVSTRPVPRPLPTDLEHKLRELDHLYVVNRKDYRANKNRLNDPLESKVCINIYKKRINALEIEEKRILAEIDRLIDSDDTLKKDAKRLATIPGVAEKTVRATLAMFGDLRQYKRGELIALAGLYPDEFKSGTSVHRKSKLVKGGGARLRGCLYMGTLTSRRKCPQLRAFADRLKKRGKHDWVIRCALMRKTLLLMRSLVINEIDYCEDYGKNVPYKAA